MKLISLHFFSKIILTSLPFLSKLSFLGTMEDTRTVLFFGCLDVANDQILYAIDCDMKGDRGWVLSCSFCFCFLSLMLLLFVLSCPLFLCFKRLEHDSCCVCFFVFFVFFSLSLVSLTRSYWSMEIVVSVM